MRSLATLFFILALGVGSLFAQNKKSEKQKQDSVASTVTVKAPNTQLIQQDQKDSKNPVGADQLRNVGYGKVKASNVTGSVSTLTPNENEMDSYTNIYQYLQGRVPGVTVNGTSIQIRGIKTVYGSTEPLIVLNGVPLGSSMALSDVNPQDVKSIEVLKGPSAAIYGSRGANGVIIITTKN